MKRLSWIGRLFGEQRGVLAHAQTWRMPAGHAQTWVAPCAGRLCVTLGRVWASCTSPRHEQASDHVLLADDHLSLHAGQQVVLEPWPRGPNDAVVMQWLPLSGTEGLALEGWVRIR